MSKTLKTLIKLSKNEVDRLQKELADLLNQQQFFRDKIAKLENEIAVEKKFAEEAPELNLNFGEFAKANRNKIAAAQTRIDQIETDVLELREKLQEAFSEQKKFEIVDANKQLMERKEFEHKETIKLDEVGSSIFSRNAKND